MSGECNYLFLWKSDIFKSMVTQCTANLGSLVIYHILATQWYHCKYNAYRIYSRPQYAKLASSWLDDAQLMWPGSCCCSWGSNVWHRTAFQYDLFRESHILLPKVGGGILGKAPVANSCWGTDPAHPQGTPLNHNTIYIEVIYPFIQYNCRKTSGNNVHDTFLTKE